MSKASLLRRYLLWFANEHLDFRLQEINSIATLLKVNLSWIRKTPGDPFWIVELPGDDEVVKLTSRSVTLRYAIELWSSSEQREDFHDQLKSLPSSFTDPHFNENVSFKVKVEVFGSSQTHAQKVQRIESFSYLPLKGPVKLKNPDVSFQYIEYYGHDPSNIPEEPYQFYFGRIVSEGQRDLISKLSLKTRKFIGNTSMDPQLSLIMANQGLVENGALVYDPFVGSGSLLIGAAQFGGLVMGADLDYLMLHGKSRPTRKQARINQSEHTDRIFSPVWYHVGIQAPSPLPVQKDDLCSPFKLIFSLDFLLSRSNPKKFALVFLPSVDITCHINCNSLIPTHNPQIFSLILAELPLELKPRQEENILANMIQYGLAHRYVDIVVADFSLPLWHDCFKLDAIITDPPYGVREAVERVGTTRQDKSVGEHHLPTHIPSKIQYDMAQLLHDLLAFAAKHLRIGARLVTWIPIIRLEYDENQLPHHECLRLIANSEQILSTNASRRLLTYEKIGEPQVSIREIVTEKETFRQKYSRYIDENKKQKTEDEHKDKKLKNCAEQVDATALFS